MGWNLAPREPGRTLVAYATKCGVTAQSAVIIAETLRTKCGRTVDVVDLGRNKKPDITPYDSIFVGSGIRIGMWYGRARRFLKRDFGDRPVAVFISSCRAGDPAEHFQAVASYLNRVLEKSRHLNLVASAAFGGRYIARGRTRTDNYDPAGVRAWAEEVGRLLGDGTGRAEQTGTGRETP